ncbi:MAG: leucine-rich repeat protein [Treponema sp.]|nr:leucine-rich repeat protein [Treponema sp.]
MEDSPFYIGNYSQSGREDLEDLEFNEQVHAVGIGAFYGCPNLSRIVLNKNLNYIAPLAFAACPSLKEVVADSNIIALARNAFDQDASQSGDCSQDPNARDENRSQDQKTAALEPAQILLKNPSYKLEGGLLYNAKWRSILFAQDKYLAAIEFPKNTKSIGWYAFEGCENLQEVDIPPTVEWIGERAFSNCVGLKKFSLTKSVKQIEQAAFMNCSALEEFKIPKGAEEIAAFTFSGCKSLREIEIPLSVRTIRENAFEFCSSLEKVTVSKWCQIEDGAFDKGVEVHRL